MIVVTAAIIQKDGKILATRRSPGKHLGGYWEFPGGKVEGQESGEECLVREILEELGIQISVQKFFMENIHHYETKSIRLLGYWATIERGEIQLTDHDDFRWMTLTALHTLEWAPADVPFVQAIQRSQS